MSIPMNYKFPVLIVFILLFMLSSCGPSERELTQQEQRQQQLQMQMVESTPEFNRQMTGVLDRYFDLKDALVDSDAERAKIYTSEFSAEAENVNAESLNRESAAIWASYSEIITSNGEELINRDDVDDQRYYFEYISEAMIEVVETFRPVGYEIYHQSCPMVRDGSADWLSREEEIRNPYHGDRMMRCGEVINRI